MNKKPAYAYIIDLLDFSEELISRINKGDSESNSYFMTLLYIEDVLDKYGRGLTRTSADQENLDANEIASEVIRRMGGLRVAISNLIKGHDYTEVVESRFKDFHHWVGQRNDSAA